MNAHLMTGLATSIGIFGAFHPPPAGAWEPIRAHPQNPHLLEFRGEPTVLRTFAQHYSSVVNTSFDFVPYLDVLHRDGMNLTRVFLIGFVETQAMPTPLAPSPADLVQPWHRSNSHGTALDGLGKWDFSTWDEGYFDRLRTFVRACSDRGIVTELTLFSTFYTDAHWQASPFNPLNNVQGYGPANRYDAFRGADGNLVQVQEAAVRRIVREVNEFDNLTIEVQNEPFWNEPSIKDDQEVAFHQSMLGIIRDEETALPHRHLVAHNFPLHADDLSPGFDVLNEHYPVAPPNPVIAGAEVLLRDHYFRNMVLALDETTTPSPLETRLEAWMFLLGGGGIYNGLDIQHFVYSEDDETGDSELGRSFRSTVRGIGSYIDNLHLVPLRRDFSWIENGIPNGVRVQAMANPGQQYVAYIHHGQGGDSFFYNPIDTTDHSLSLAVSLETGTWRAVWTRPSDLAELQTEELIHPGGTCLLAPVVYQEDVALRIDRTGDGDATPPPRPAGLAAIARADGSVLLSWNPVQAHDLASYRIYRATDTPVPIDDDHRIAIVPAPDVSFNDGLTGQGITYHYTVTAADLGDNESSASREFRVVSTKWSLPYGGTPWSIPGIIQAEDFDAGGQGVAYNDLTPSGTGEPCRDGEAVDLATTTDEGGGFQVIETRAGEWMNYTIHVAAPGKYLPQLRIANDSADGAVHMEIDTMDVTGVIAIPATAGTDSWETIAMPAIELPAGEHVLRLVMDSDAAGSFNWISFTAIPSAGPIANAGPDLAVVDLDGDGLEAVALDASASTAGDLPIRSYVWFENGIESAGGVAPTLNLRVGEHPIELIVTDERGLQSSDVMMVAVTPRQFGNGGFEAGYDGWRAAGNQTLGGAPSYQAADGSRCIAFNDANRLPNGVLSQTFATIPGQIYQLQFDMGVLAYNSLQQRMQVEVSGDALLVSETFAITGTGGGRTVWLEKDLSFIADSTASTLAFRDVSTVSNALDLLLDDVRIIPRVVRTLTIDSIPNRGIPVTVSPPDENGVSDGLTRFSRVFPDARAVTLAAPASAAGCRFQKWTSNGTDVSSNPVISVIMNTDREISAIYVENAPVITSQPTSVHSGIGGSATFRVTAEGSGTLSYQWRFNGADIPGANGASHTIDPIEEQHAGSYDVVVGNSLGSVTSEAAVLAVHTTGLINGSFESAYEGWRAEGNQNVVGPPSYLAADGGRCVAFNNANRLPDGVLSQTFSTTPGQLYRLVFDMGVIAYNSLQQRMRVELAGNTILVSEIITITGGGAGRTVWEEKDLLFMADSTASTLTFRDVSTVSNSIDLLLDDVRVMPHSARNLTVDSIPGNGVSIAVSPPDEARASDGITRFSRSYRDAREVSLTAPSRTAGFRFRRWTLDGSDAGTDPVIRVTMDLDHTLIAVYEEVPPVITNLVNGSFESGYDGWRAEGHQIIGNIPAYQANDGGRCVAFNNGNSLPNGVLSQTFATIPGRIYQLYFDMGVLAYNNNPQRMQVELSGSAIPVAQAYTLTGGGAGRTLWEEKRISFTAVNAECTLTFRDLSSVSTALDLLLDDVRIELQSAALEAVTAQSATAADDSPPPVPPTISRVDGTFRIHMTAPASGWYELQRSGDLTHWMPVSRLHAAKHDELEFHDGDGREKRMFYRIALPGDNGAE